MSQNGKGSARRPSTDPVRAQREYDRVFHKTKSPAIYGFFGAFRSLSNFATVAIPYINDGPLVKITKLRCPDEAVPIIFTTTEHAYQACKALDYETLLSFTKLEKPGQAKRLGGQIKLRPDWDQIKIDVMTEINKIKFQQEPYKKLLLDTGDGYLEETNTWNDTFWGVCEGKGKNNLGHILMDIRECLQAQVSSGE